MAGGKLDLPAQFEALMNKSPIVPGDIRSFLREMRRSPSGAITTSRLLALKIQSTSETQAIQAFDVLEECLSSEAEGSIEFRTEIGRFRFLNEIVRILSPNYMGDKTLLPVKERAVKFLQNAAGPKRKQYFPSEHSKIVATWQSLIDGGIIKKAPISEADEEAELQKSIFEREENAKVLKKLLQSKEPSDIQAANRLIKNLVELETKRIERRAELHSLIDRIDTAQTVLTELLSQRHIDKEMVDELAETCRSLRQRLGGVATETSDETTSLLNASQNLEKVLELYEKRISMKDEDLIDDTLTEAENIKKEEKAKPSALSLADEFLLKLDVDFGLNTSHHQPSKRNVTTINNLNLDGSINKNDNLVNFDVELPSKVLASSSDVVKKNNEEPQPQPKRNPLDEIGLLSKELMEQGLMKGTSLEFSKKIPEKTPINQVQPSFNNENNIKSQVPLTPPQLVQDTSRATSDPILLLDFDYLDKPEAEEKSTSPSSQADSLLLDLNQELVETKSKNNNLVKEFENISKCKENGGLELRKLLGSIKELDLDKVDIISGVKPLNLTLDGDENVNLTITFAQSPDFPSQFDIKVCIITFANKHPNSSISNFVFQLIPPKGLQIKLLPPTTMELPPWKKSFLPPPILTQVAILVFPSQDFARSIPKIKFILSYTIDDDDTALHNGEFSLCF